MALSKRARDYIEKRKLNGTRPDNAKGPDPTRSRKKATPITDNMRARWVDDFSQGMSALNISVKYNVSRGVVEKHLRRLRESTDLADVMASDPGEREKQLKDACYAALIFAIRSPMTSPVIMKKAALAVQVLKGLGEFKSEAPINAAFFGGKPDGFDLQRSLTTGAAEKASGEAKRVLEKPQEEQAQEDTASKPS